MPVVRIDDARDPRVADYANIPDPDLARRGGLFVAEGRLVVRRLLSAGTLAVRSVMVTDAALAALEDVLDRAGVPVLLVPQAIMNTIAGFNIHRGCLAIGERPEPARWSDIARNAARLVVAERVGDAGNIGSLFRNAAAFGAGGVLLGPGCADPLYRKAIRTSMGAALTMPTAPIHPWPDALVDLRRSGYVTMALTPDAGAIELHQAATQTASRSAAIVVGHEGEGLTSGALGACELRVRIPMAGSVDSINVATASAIALYALAPRGTPEA